MASRSLTDLHPAMQAQAALVLEKAHEAGVDLLVTCTRRSLDEQARLYAQGRTTPGPIVTRAKPGESAHNVGLAMDCVPMRDGKPVWGTKLKSDRDLWAAYGAAVRAAGLVWGGDWRGGLVDLPHAEFPDWRNNRWNS